MRSTISSKGQVTVPAEVRARLGLLPGTPVEFELQEEGVLLRKGVKGAHPVDRVYGIFRLGRPVDELLDEMRGPRPRPSKPPGDAATATGSWPTS
jgi:AbrB family looped-hinge helix DNA binding protein